MCWWSLCLQSQYVVDICIDGLSAFKGHILLTYVLMVSLPSKVIFCWHMCWWSLCLQSPYFVDMCWWSWNYTNICKLHVFTQTTSLFYQKNVLQMKHTHFYIIYNAINYIWFAFWAIMVKTSWTWLTVFYTWNALLVTHGWSGSTHHIWDTWKG
jgi:hypothetical protein